MKVCVACGHEVDQFANFCEFCGKGQNPRQPIPARLRKLILDRDHSRCQSCGRGVEHGVTLHIDHVLPVALGGTNDPDNLQTLCDECNLGKGKYVPELDPVLRALQKEREERKAAEEAERRREERERAKKAAIARIARDSKEFRALLLNRANTESLEIIEFLDALIREFHWLSCIDGVNDIQAFLSSQKKVSQSVVDSLAEPFSVHAKWIGSTQSLDAKQVLYAMRINEAASILARTSKLKKKATTQGAKAELASWEKRFQKIAKVTPDWGRFGLPKPGTPRDERATLKDLMVRHQHLLLERTEFQKDIADIGLFKDLDGKFRVSNWRPEFRPDLRSILEFAIESFTRLGPSSEVIAQLQAKPQANQRRIYFNRLEEGLVKPQFFRKAKLSPLESLGSTFPT